MLYHYIMKLLTFTHSEWSWITAWENHLCHSWLGNTNCTKKQHPILSQITRVQSCQSWEHDTYHLAVKKFPVASVVGCHDWQSESLLPSRVYPGNPVYGAIEGSSSIGRLCDPRMGSSSVVITDLQHATVTYNTTATNSLGVVSLLHFENPIWERFSIFSIRNTLVFVWLGYLWIWDRFQAIGIPTMRWGMRLPNS